MPKISIKTPDDLKSVHHPEVFSGPSGTMAYFDSPEDPLHLYLHELTPGDTLFIDRSDIDRLAYVWQGEVQANHVVLRGGSSLIVEHDQTIEMSCGEKKSLVLTFSSAMSPAQPRKGGSVHLLPTERVPRCEMHGGLKGGMHADSDCPTGELWLHENQFPGQQGTGGNAEKGIHAHSEDEIIFVTEGEIHFGTKIGGPGTAVAIAADTFYSFTPGPAGLGFINFRASMPNDIRFKNGDSMSETEYWRKLVSRPEYLTSS